MVSGNHLTDADHFWHYLGTMEISSVRHWQRKVVRLLQEATNWSLPAMIRRVSGTYGIPQWIFWLALVTPLFQPVGEVLFRSGDLTFFAVMVPGLAITLFQQVASEVIEWVALYGVVLGLVIASVLVRLSDPLRAIALSTAAIVRLVCLRAPPPLVRNSSNPC